MEIPGVRDVRESGRFLLIFFTHGHMNFLEQSREFFFIGVAWWLVLVLWEVRGWMAAVSSNYGDEQLSNGIGIKNPIWLEKSAFWTRPEHTYILDPSRTWASRLWDLFLKLIWYIPAIQQNGSIKRKKIFIQNNNGMTIIINNPSSWMYFIKQKKKIIK